MLFRSFVGFYSFYYELIFAVELFDDKKVFNISFKLTYLKIYINLHTLYILNKPIPLIIKEGAVLVNILKEIPEIY